MSIPPNGRHAKPPRRYDSTRRRAQAAETRQDILKAALQLFLEGCYAGTTISDVAAAAGEGGGETCYGGLWHGDSFSNPNGGAPDGDGSPPPTLAAAAPLL